MNFLMESEKVEALSRRAPKAGAISEQRNVDNLSVTLISVKCIRIRLPWYYNM